MSRSRLTAVVGAFALVAAAAAVAKSSPDVIALPNGAELRRDLDLEETRLG
jgi:hypothetical protein